MNNRLKEVLIAIISSIIAGIITYLIIEFIKKRKQNKFSIGNVPPKLEGLTDHFVTVNLNSLSDEALANAMRVYEVINANVTSDEKVKLLEKLFENLTSEKIKSLKEKYNLISKNGLENDLNNVATDLYNKLTKR
jgi:hypothetical protein